MAQTNINQPASFLMSEKIYIRRKKRRLLPGDDGEYKSKIGSSFKYNSVLRGLDPEEEVKYLPEIIGSDSAKQDWAKKTEEYWQNLSVDVPDTETGLELEIGFKYKTDKDREEGKNGTPISIADYVLYRYCLLYSRVANTEEDMNNSPKIRFYIYSKKKELSDKISLVKAKQQAFAEYLKIVDNTTMISNILMIFKVGQGLRLNKEEQTVAISDLVDQRPIEFLRVATDPNLLTRSLIEKCLIAKHIYVIPNTQTYMRGDDVLAYSTEELVTKLNNKDNEGLRTQLEALLKSIN